MSDSVMALGKKRPSKTIQDHSTPDQIPILSGMHEWRHHPSKGLIQNLPGLDPKTARSRIEAGWVNDSIGIG